MKRKLIAASVVVLLIFTGWLERDWIGATTDADGKWKSLMAKARKAEAAGDLIRADSLYSRAGRVTGRFNKDDLRVAETYIALGDIIRSEYRKGSASAVPQGPAGSLLRAVLRGPDEFREVWQERARANKYQRLRSLLPRATGCYRRAMSVYLHAVPPVDDKAEGLYTGLADRLGRLGLRKESLDCWIRVLACQEKAYGEDSLRIVGTLEHINQSADDIHTLLETRERLLGICRQAYGLGDTRTQTWLKGVASCHEQLEDYDAARSLYSDNLRYAESRFGKDSVEIIDELEALSRLDRHADNLQEADRLCVRGIRIAERYLHRPFVDMSERDPYFFQNKHWPEISLLLDNYYCVLEETGRKVEAERLRNALTD